MIKVELSHAEKIYSKAIEMVNKCYPMIHRLIIHDLKTEIPFQVLEENENVNGAYSPDYKLIFLCNDERSTVHTALHEIGHAVHHQLFDYKDFKLNELARSDYGKTNHREDFAEAFLMHIVHMYNNIELPIEREKQMKEILKLFSMK
ncbi:hypothetical protein [Priestia flexa]|uniref:hypothetical protein n=1 Tax=Priestia flexa TaxID=86664 RepID=UPI00047439E7|nr:hypothetical protein [Priestia flexa]